MGELVCRLCSKSIAIPEDSIPISERNGIKTFLIDKRIHAFSYKKGRKEKTETIEVIRSPAESVKRFAPKSTELFIETEAAKANSLRDKLRAESEQLDEYSDSGLRVRRYRGCVKRHPNPRNCYITANGLDWIVDFKNDAPTEYLRLLGHHCLPEGTPAEIEITDRDGYGSRVTGVRFDLQLEIPEEEISQVVVWNGRYGSCRRFCGCRLHISQTDVTTYGTIKPGTWIQHKTIQRDNEVLGSEIQIFMEQ